MNPEHVVNRSRREAMLTTLGAAVAAGLPASPVFGQAQKPRGLPDYATWKDADALIVHSARTVETQRNAFGTSVVTPSDMLFIRNNLSPPAPAVVERPDEWRVRVEGVRQPRELTVAELKRLGITAVPMVLQCSGNGRGFFEHKASGTQWRVGASGCVIFSGVPVAAVVRELGGMAEGARFMTATGGETIPQGIDPKTVVVERSVPLAVHERALLAWELNGEPLPLAHGGPLRLVVPGFYGVNNVKYVKQLAFTPTETDAAIQRTGYRVRPIGQKGAPDQPSMWDMAVKSFITSPVPADGTMPAGNLLVIGVAFAGERPIRDVAVSVDGGASWQRAELFGPDLGPYAWRQFLLPARLGAGKHALASRATDAAGNTQPEQRLENERGYANNSWRDHAVTIAVS